MNHSHAPAVIGIYGSLENKDIQKVDSSNRYHAMIHHQNADAMGLSSALMRGITPLDVRHFEYFQGGECLSNAHWLGP